MSLAVQFQTMFAMTVMGLVLGMSIDFYHRLTMRVVKAVWTRAVCDVFFWLVQALLIFFVLLRVNEGELRIYIFLAIAVGFLFYYRFARKSFLNILEGIFSVCLWTSRTITALVKVMIISPIKFILKLAVSSVMMGLTLVSNVLLFLLKLLLSPLKLIMKLIIPIVRRYLPEPMIQLLKKFFRAVRKRVKGWWIFK